MRGELSPVATGLLLFLAGCATPPLHVVPIATISNDATLTYAYGEGGSFRLPAAPVEITALVPRASGDDALAAAGSDAADAAATSGAADAAATVKGESARSASSTAHAEAEMRQAQAGAFQQERQLAGSTRQTVAGWQHDDAAARSSQEGTADGSTINSRLAAASGDTRVEHSFVSASAAAGSGITESRHSDIGRQAAQAYSDTRNAHASSAWSTSQPSIRKWATLSRVVVGDQFQYIVEIHNGTPLDLAYAEVTDSLDHRLSVAASDVETAPRAETEVDLKDGLLSVKFPNGIRRGRTVKILIPTVLRMDLAEQDKSR